MKVGKRQNRSGFTLIEAIVASLILCASIMALGAISTRSLVGTRLNRQYEKAASLAQRQLQTIYYIGIDDFLEGQETEGDFQTSQPVYHWEFSAERVGIGNLYQAKVSVSWIERKHQYSVDLETRLNGSGEAELEQEQEPEQ